MPARTILGQAGPTTTAATTYPGDVFFGSGRPWYDVRTFGAKADGTTDDSTAINNAIAKAATAVPTGAYVYLPAGNYATASSINMQTDVTLVGAGVNTTTISYSGTGAAIAFAAGAGGLEAFVVANLLIAGTASGDSGLSFSNNGGTPARGLVQNVKIQSFSKPTGSGGAGVRVTNAIELTFDRVDCSSNYNGWDISGSGTTTIALRGCLGRSNTNIGCYLHTGIRSVSIDEQSQFSTNAAQGIYVLADSVDNITNVSILNSWVESNDTGGSAIGMVHVTATGSGRIHNFVIERTYITATTYYAGSVSLFADYCDGHAYNILVDAASPATNAINVGTNTIGNGFALQGVYNTGTLPIDPNATAVRTLVGKLQTGTTVQTGTANRFRMLQSMAKIEQANINQTLATSVVTVLAFTAGATVDVNTDTIWASGSPTRMTAQIAGKYDIQATVLFPSQANGAGICEVIFRKNGGTTMPDVCVQYYPTGNAMYVNLTALAVPLAATDYLEVEVYQTSGNNVTINSATFAMMYRGE